MAKLNFTAQTARKRPIKPISDRYKESPLRPNIEVSDGIRPAFPLIPLRYLDVKFKDITTEQWVVIPKGRIVSAVTVQNNTLGNVLNLAKQDSDGKVYVGTVDQTDGVTALYVGADESYYGYTRDIVGLMVPANGGTQRIITYDADDVAAMVPDAATGGVVSVGDTYTLPANMPIGVAMYDVYQDIRGAFINYELYKTYGILAEQLIKIPFVDFGLLNTLAAGVKFVDHDSGTTKSGYKVGAATIDASADAGYLAVEKRFSFLYFDSAQAEESGISGQLLQSDLFGNWVPAGADVANSDSISLNPARTAQTIGRLMGVDTRFPKDLVETVETPYGQRIAGTGTEGLPEALFEFGKDILVAGGYNFAGVDPAKVVKDLVQEGAFGYAVIQLMAR
jgi:hypothetical protein